ncbi:T9SS type A sorting domain-containing protein [Parasediminibacterium sp. JCM 36343]|uniref:T9SS type A sorting domain-containing protein n=1 Tax=Parasediminibacterium sp. JCM 36343 TaxID=3374279 RepID=UPI00397C36CD
MASFLVRILSVILFVGLLASATHAQTTYKWGNVAFGGGGFVSGLLTCKYKQNLIYARTDVGGAYRWNDTTSTWVPLLDWCNTNQTSYQGVESFAIDPSAPNKLYMLVGTSYFNGGSTAILRSNNYGATFSITNVTNQFKASGNGGGRNNGEKLQVDPNNGNVLFCGTRRNGLFKSTNAGVSWAQVASLGTIVTPNDNGISWVVMDSSSGLKGFATPTIFVGISDTGTNVYRSDDGGTSFNPIVGATTTLMPQRAVLASDHNLYITYADKEGPSNASIGQIWKYNTQTGVWTNVTPTGVTYPFSGISVDPNNPLKIIASTINTYQIQYGNTRGDRFYLTTDGGTTWRDLIGNGIRMNTNGCPWFASASIHWAGSIEFDPFNTNKAWVISGNGLFYCNSLSSATNTWYFGARGIEETVPQDIASIPNGPLFTAIGDYDGFKNTDPTLYGTRFSPTMGSNNGVVYAGLNPQKLLRVGNSIYYTNNQGTTWTKTATAMGTGNNIALSADGSIFMHCPDRATATYWSTNNGTNWTASTGIAASQPVADPVNPKRFYAYNSGDGNMYTSIDGGVSFTVAGTPGKGGNTLIRTAPYKQGHLWLAMNNGGLMRSIDSGANYIKIPGVTVCGSVGLGKADTSSAANYYAIYIWGTVSGVTGVFRSTNLGTTWTRVNDNAHQYGGTGNGQFVAGDFNVFGRVYMSTVGRGVPYADLVTTLPVQLVYFSGTLNQQGQTLLKWQTGTETNNNYFDIEKSTDGTVFSTVGTVASKNIVGSGAGFTYNYTDIGNNTGTIYYRLKQVDKEGAYTYSNVIKLSSNTASEETIKIYPNPAIDGNINLQLQLKTAKNINISITNMNGKTVYQRPSIYLPLGTSSIKITDADNLPKGVYIVQVIAGNDKTIVGTSKLVIE